MAQLEAAAVAEADVVTTAPEQTQAVETTEAVERDDALAFYADENPEEPEVDDQGDIDGEEQDDEPAEAVVAPASLKPEEKEQFAQLPPEAQRMLSETLVRRDRETQQGLEQARSAQREAERSAADHVATAQRVFAQKFDGLVQAFAPQPPPVEMAREDPTEFLFLDAQYRQQLETYQQLVGQVSQLTGQSNAHFEARSKEWLDEQVSQLRSIPEFADDAARPKFQAEIAAIGTELGFSEQELSNVTAKDVFALNKVRSWKAAADKWGAHQKKRNERPRQAMGRFSAAPAGSGAKSNGVGASDLAKLMYPND